MKKTRYILFALGLIVAGAVGALVFLHSEAGKSFLMARAKTYLESQYGLLLNVDEVDYNLLKLSASLRGLSLGKTAPEDLPPILWVDQVVLDLSMGDLLLGRVTIDDLLCEGAEVNVVLDSTGESNLPSRLQSTDGRDDPFGTDIVISSLIVTEGTFSLQDKSRGLVLEIPNWSLEVSGHRASRTHSIHLSTGLTSEFRVRNKSLLLDQFEARSTLSPDGLRLESLEIQWDRSELEMVGTFPFSPSAELDSEVTVSIDSSQLAHFFGLSEPLSGQIDVRLHLGNSIQAPTLEAQLTGEQLSWRSIDDINVAAEFEWKIKQARVMVRDALLATPHGSLQGAGQIALTNEAGNSNASFQFSRVDFGRLGKFLGNGFRVASLGTGEASLSWPAMELEQFIGTGVLTLRASQKTARVGLLPVSGSLSFSATREDFLISTEELRAGDLHLTAETTVQRNEGLHNPGSGELSGRISGFSDDLGSDFTSLMSFLGDEGLPIGAGGKAEFAAELKGTLENPQTSFTLQASEVESYAIPGIDLEVAGEIDQRKVQLSEAFVRWRDGSARLAGSLYLNETEPELDFAGSFKTLSLKDLAVALGYPIVPEGEAAAEFTLTGTVPRPKLSFESNISDLRLAGETLGYLNVVGKLDNNVLDFPTLTLREPVSKGSDVLTASARLDFVSGTFLFDAAGRQFDISSMRLAKDWKLAGLLDLSIQGRGALSNPDVDLDLKIERPSISGHEVAPLDVKATFQNSQFVANVLAADSGLSALVSGRVVSPYPVRVSIRAENADLNRFPFLKQRVPQLTGALTGELLAQGDLFDWRGAQLSTALTDLHFIWNGVEARSLEPVNILYKDKSLLVEKSRVAVGDGSLEIEGSLPLERARGNSRLVGDLSFNVTDLLKLLPSDWEVKGTGDLDVQLEVAGSLLEPELSGRLRVSQCGLSGPRFPVPISDLEIAISSHGNAIQLDQLSAIAGGGTLSAEGVILDFNSTPENEPLRISASLEEFPLESLGVLPERLTGVATAQLELTSQQASLSSLVGVVAFGELQLTAGELTLRQEDQVLLSLQNGEVWLERFELAGPQSRISGSGGIDFLQPGSLDLKLGGSVSTTLLAELIGNFESSGEGQFELVIGGLPGPPQFSGTLAVSNGTLLIPSHGVEVDELLLQIRASGNEFQIERLEGDISGGSFEGEGSARYASGTIEGEVLTVITDVFLDWPRGLRTISDGVISLRSTEEGFLLDGELRILEGAYREDIDLQGAAVQYLSTGGRSDIALEPNPLLSDLNFEVGIETIDPIVLDNNLAEVALEGRLELLGSYYRPGMIGMITVEPGGEIYLRERTYAVEYGAISFIDETRIRPELSVRAQTRVQEYDVTLQAIGPLGDLETSFSSEPALAEPDVVSILLTGRTLDELRGADARVSQEQALSLLAGAAGGQIGREVENAIGISKVRIEPYLIAPESKPETRLTVGQDITSDLRGIYSVNLADSGDQIWVGEYDVTRRFRARGIKQADNTYRFDFNHRLRFPKASQTSRSSLQRRIGRLQFEGNHSFPESILSDKFRLRSGQTYDFFKAQKGLDKVRGLFEAQDLLEARIRLRRSESEGIVDLTMKIESGPVVILAFEGNEISSDIQKRVRELWSQGVSDSQRRRESIREIRRGLFQNGYLTAEADCEILFVQNTKRVTFQVTKGPEFQEATLVFKGLEAFEPDWLETQLKEADLVLELFLDPTQTTDFIRGLYRQRGFLEARVESRGPGFDEATSEAKVTLEIVEGPLYRVGEIDFQGNRVIDDQALQEVAGVKTEDVYYPGIVGEMVARVEDLYRSRGYNRSEIADTGQRALDHRVDLTVQIVENIQDIVEKIEISGQERVSARFIERQMGVEVGEVLDLSIVSRARKRLYDTGAFSLVEIEPVETQQLQASSGTQRPMRLMVKVRETVPHRFNYGAFFDTDRGPGVTVDYRNHNLLRNGRVLGASGRFDGDRREVRGYFSQPARYWFPLRTYASTFLARELRPSFEFDEVGFSIEQQAELRDTLIGSYGFSFARNQIRATDPDSELEDLPLNVGALNTSLAWDTRDSFLEPTGGHFLSSSFKFAPTQLGSDFPFVKYFGSYSRYFPLTKPSKLPFSSDSQESRLIFATWVRVGLAKGFDQNIISPTERFFAGGGTTIRGFKQDTVGPLNDDGVAVGGNSLFIWNNELRFPMFSILEGVGFLDVGNVYSAVSEFNPLEVRKAAGFGLRVRTPFVLIRFDYGFKLDRNPGESRGAFFFSIGQAF